MTKKELAEAFDVSTNTIDAWLRRGCPYETKGGPGRPWSFNLNKVLTWKMNRETGPQVHEDPPELPEGWTGNLFRDYANEGARLFVPWFFETMPKIFVDILSNEGGITDPARIKKVSDCILAMAFHWLSVWIAEDHFNQRSFAPGDSDIDDLWEALFPLLPKTTQAAAEASEIEIPLPKTYLEMMTVKGIKKMMKDLTAP